MQIAMDSLCLLFTRAFDAIESETHGTSNYHSLRVAVLCAEMGKASGYDTGALSTLMTCALFHDSASKIGNYMRHNESHSGERCCQAQRNIELLPFAKDVTGYILHHRSKNHGNTPFSFPYEAMLIGAANYADVNFPLHNALCDINRLKNAIYKLAENTRDFSRGMNRCRC